MAKLLGVEDGMPVQAAAGGTSSASLQQRLQSPTGVLLATGLLAFGWIVGRELGRSARDGTSLMDTTKRKTATEGEEWLSAVAAYGALGITGQFTLQLAQEYGWGKVFGYSGTYLVVVSAIKKFTG